ncbi:hypothetical protein FRC98_01885 [Lujinxingia vulgaris]|uniref:Uncharacterized protein n=1 Tax=Lujinxingia vulgaris TaxID=2600176 RepID=A0A5C6XB89_9DELT|nr:hypothetical protein [Lujinxingia vulgaris]TXD39176.1 hypothetical protein FRC98_01885 [Lujinxingia vulgaris]
MNAMLHPPNTSSSGTLPAVPAVLVALAALATLLAPMSAHALSCVPQPEYLELDAQIEQVWKDERFDCLVVQPEVRPEKYRGSVEVFVDFANACGEDVWVLLGDERAPGERVADGELLTLSAEVDQLYGESEGEGELPLSVLFGEGQVVEEVWADEYEGLALIQYSYSGVPNDHDGSCGDDRPFYGCAAYGGGGEGQGPAGLMWVVLGVGVVWVGRRVGVRRG